MKKNVNMSEMMNGAVENAKVLNTSYKLYKVGTQGFLNDGGTVVFVTVSAVKVDLRGQAVTTTMKDAKGREYVRQGEFMLYETTAAHEKGRKVNRFIYKTGELLQKADPRVTENAKVNVIDVDEENGTSNIYMEVWSFTDGNAVCVPAKVDAVEWNEDGWHIAAGTLPEKYWATKADTYQWNAYKVVDEDGDEFTEKSATLRLQPTDEQAVALKQLKAAFEKAKAAGLGFIWDRECCGNVMAYNTAGVVDFNCGPTRDEKGGDLVCPSEVTLTDTGIDFFDYLANDDYLFALKPTERQLKQWAKDHPDAKC